MNYKLISQEINLILSNVYKKYLKEGRTTKKGGLRFLDPKINKTFSFENTKETHNGNLLCLSAPYTGDVAKIEKELKKGPRGKDIESVFIRTSHDPGKEKRLFVELRYFINTGKIISNEKILFYSKTNNNPNTNLISKILLREYIEPYAKECMDHLVKEIKK